jgi:predicted transcriptional regulator
METTIHIRIENETRDAIQRIAEMYEWPFSQAARKVIKLGLERVQREEKEQSR